MKSCISGVGLILCIAAGAAAQRNSTVDPSRRGAAQRDAFDTAFNATAAQTDYDLLHQSDRSPIQSSALPDLYTNQRTTVSVKELQHKIPASALKEDSKGIKAVKKGDYQTALDHFQEAADIDPRFTDALNDLGAALAKLGHTEQAAEQFRKALDLSPYDERVLANLSLVLLRLRQYHEAGVMASRALKIDPRDVQICYVRAVALFFENGDNDEALYNMRRAAVQFPRARLMASEILVETGRRGEAVQQLEEYLRSTPKSESNRAQVEARLAQLRQ